MKDQFVIACVENQASADAILPMARLCSTKLKKGLILLNVSDDGQNEWLKQYGHPYIGLRGDWKTAIDGLPTAFSGILAITAVDTSASRRSITHPSTLLRTFRDCKIAYLVVDMQWSNNHHLTYGDENIFWPQTSCMTIDHRRESKEKLIWASYLVRFFNSELTAVAPRYKDSGLLARQSNNIRFMKKMYTSLGINYNISTPPISNFQNPDQVALDTIKPDILVVLATDRRDKDIGDFLLGTPEFRLLSHPSAPLLILNQRDDLYVLCD